MSTTDTDLSSPLPPTAPPRRLRRSRTGRVGAGVASGLGEYFGLDPVLFRVLFATSAFFGGAGVIGYLLAWAAIPEAGTERAPIDGWIGELRRRHVPPWLVAVVVGIVLWAAAFSWWAPGPFFPVLLVVIVLVVVFGRRDRDHPPASTPVATPAATPVDLTKPMTAAPGDDTEVGTKDTTTADTTARPQDPAWLADTRSWFSEQRAIRRVKRRRAMPVRLAVLGVLVATLVVLGTVDAVHGIALPLYFAITGGIVLAGLLIGLVLRRPPWALAGLLIPSALGLIAFGGTHASLHDGIGQHEWRPASTPSASYRLAMGQAVLDLRKLSTQDRPRTVNITMAAGQVKVIAPKTLNLTVETNVHLGDVNVDDQHYNGGSGAHSGGFNYNRIVDPPAGATGQPLTVIVHLADGNITVDHR